MPIFEDRIRNIGWGLYHKFVLGMVCMCALSQAMAFMSIPFALPIAACDTYMAKSTILSVNLALYIGMAVGGYFLNSATDIVGRKSMIPTTLILVFGSNFASGFSHGHPMFVVCAFMLGAGLAGNMCATKIFLAEILHSSSRGFYIVFVDIFWSLGYLLSAIVYWLTMPFVLYSRAAEMRLATWRLMFGFSSGLSIMVACASALLDQSPRYLLYSKMHLEAVDTLRHMYTINNSKHHETFRMREEELANIITDFQSGEDLRYDTCMEQIFKRIKQLGSKTCLILSRRFVAVTIILTCIKLPSLFGILIVNIWLSKMLNTGKEECNLTGMNVSHIEISHEDKCVFTMEQSLYRDFFLIGVNILIGQLLLLCVIEKFGRRTPIVCGYTTCGIASMFLAYVENLYFVRLVISSVFMVAYSLVQSTFSVILIELYPTAIRGTAAGHTQVLSYALCGFIIKYLQMPCQYSFIVMGSLMLAASALAFFLPDVCGRPMVE